MCLSTAYKNGISDDNILMKNVMQVECEEGRVILTDLMERKCVFEGRLKKADLTEGWVVLESA